jgi:apolipoprotein N-acyltransferase
LPLALAAGALVPLSLAPFDVVAAGIVAVALLYVLVRVASVRGALWLGYAFGIGRYGLGVSWVYVSIHEYGGAPPWLAAIIVALFVAGLAWVDAAATWAWRRWCATSGCAGALAFAATWTLREWVLTWLLTGFPWLLLGYGHLETPLAGFAPLGGVLAVGFAAALTATLAVAAMADLLAVPRRRLVGLAALLSVAGTWLVGAGLGTLQWVQATGEVDVALVQGNIAQSTKWQPGQAERSLADYVTLSAPHLHRDLVVWPEAAVTYLHDAARPLLDELRRRVESAGGGALVTGIVGGSREGGYRNLVVVAGHDASYAKQRLVPFGEYVPLEPLLRGLIGFFDLPMSHTRPGAAVQPPLAAAGLRLGTAICYEIVYGNRLRRQAADADLLLTVSNDTWFGTSIGPLQHAQMARMRAREFGRDLLRATNNGVTAVIAADGSVRAVLPQFVPAVLAARATLHAGRTPYQRGGDACIVAVAAAIALLAWRRAAAGTAGGKATLS